MSALRAAEPLTPAPHVAKAIARATPRERAAPILPPRVMLDPLDNITPELAHRLAAFELDDLGNAERLAYLYGERILFVPGIGWHVYDGRRWARDETAEVPRLAARMVRALFEVAGDIAKSAGRDGEADPEAVAKSAAALLKHAVRSAKGRGIALAVEKLRDEQEVKRVHVLAEQLDADLHLLNVANGTVDLRTGELRPHDPRDLITKLAPVAYDPDASAPRWLAFQNSITNGDADLIAWKRRAFGYTATGETREQALVIAYGRGSNGKSTEQEVIADALGDYADVAAFTTFAAGRNGQVKRFGLAHLAGARYVRATEGNAGDQLAEGTVKAITGGDTITAEFKGRDEFTFKPRMKLWLGTNHRPNVSGTDEGIWRRLRLVPYPVRFERPTKANPNPPHPIDADLPDKLRDELPGILAWIVAGAREWYAHGLGECEAVTGATDDYRADMDTLGDFMRECVSTSDPGGRELSSRLLDAHRGWCRGNRQAPLDAKAFKTALIERGMTPKRYTAGVAWPGVTLTELGERYATAEQNVEGARYGR